MDWIVALVFTPRFTTASGGVSVTGFPYAGADLTLNGFGVVQSISAAFGRWPNTSTFLVAEAAAGQSYSRVIGRKVGALRTVLGATNLTSASAHTLSMAGRYRV